MKTALSIGTLNLKVGDILTGTSYYYGNHVYFYKVEGFKGDKTIILRHLREMYDSKYASNSPGYYCAPDSAELTDEQMDALFEFSLANNFSWHRFELGTLGEKTCRAYNSERYGEYFKIVGDKYHPTLYRWEGDAKWGCCD